MVSMMTVVQQDPLYNASPEMSELTGPAATPMPPLPRLPGLSDDFTLPVLHEEADEEGEALADFFDCNTKEDEDDDDDDNDNDNDNDNDSDDMDDGGGDSDEEGPEHEF